ncbi:hypothetical protein [Methylobacterium oryzae]|uniref:hypothetical protein n=1 Tax=Methylobacterium oryzae TaxID=334852 RepID=UPI001F3206EF|nr:hypothetical protein [Methylobacterium oryzae]UIN34007.1 hypothetical protein LXM90_23455 [Methylobacterium oryzae]
MCGSLISHSPLGWRRVERPRVRYECLNRFASDRMLAAQSPAAHRFWKRVLDATVTVEATWVRDEAYC